MTRTLLVAILLNPLAAVSIHAQQARSSFVQWEAPSQSPTLTTISAANQRDSMHPSPGDYRYEGLAFGGLAFGALGAWLGSRDYGMCLTVPGGDCETNNDKLGNGIAFGLVGAAVGGGLGYLVGRFSPKKARPAAVASSGSSPDLASVPDSVRRRVGYQHWRGAGIGLVLGAALGAVSGAVLGDISSCDDCSQQPSPESGALLIGLIGAGAGSVTGFLAGLSSPRYVWLPADSLAQ